MKHRIDKKLNIDIFKKQINEAVGLYIGAKAAGEEAADAAAGKEAPREQR